MPKENRVNGGNTSEKLDLFVERLVRRYAEDFTPEFIIQRYEIVELGLRRESKAHENIGPLTFKYTSDSLTRLRKMRNGGPYSY